MQRVPTHGFRLIKVSLVVLTFLILARHDVEGAGHIDDTTTMLGHRKNSVDKAVVGMKKIMFEGFKKTKSAPSAALKPRRQLVVFKDDEVIIEGEELENGHGELQSRNYYNDIDGSDPFDIVDADAVVGGLRANRQLADPRCGPSYGSSCGADKPYCSNQYYCGTSSAHSGTCLQDYSHTSVTCNRCGTINGVIHGVCPTSSKPFCSSAGYCDNTYEHFQTCQDQYSYQDYCGSYRCGPNQGNKECGSAYPYCSNQGYCGDTGGHINTCLQDYTHSSVTCNRCGYVNGVNHGVCPTSSKPFCSSEGYCDDTYEHFKTCQDQYSYECGNYRCGPDQGGKVCGSAYPYCSSDGYCGDTDEHINTCLQDYTHSSVTCNRCGSDDGVYYGSCPDEDRPYCSDDDYCGTSTDHIENCQEDYSFEDYCVYQCGPGNDNAVCGEVMPYCSDEGYCGFAGGPHQEHCLQDYSHSTADCIRCGDVYGTCPQVLPYCSHDDYCGTSTDHIENCQEHYSFEDYCVYRCGPDNDNVVCGEVMPYCSDEGYCGFAGGPHQERCVQAYSHPSAGCIRCGPIFGVCPQNKPYCSDLNYCGDGNDHLVKCQEDYSYEGRESCVYRCGPENDGAVCNAEMPYCSRFGYCGFGGDHMNSCVQGFTHPDFPCERCGAIYAHGSCPTPDNPICSADGYCGLTYGIARPPKKSGLFGKIKKTISGAAKTVWNAADVVLPDAITDLVEDAWNELSEELQNAIEAVSEFNDKIYEIGDFATGSLVTLGKLGKGPVLAAMSTATDIYQEAEALGNKIAGSVTDSFEEIDRIYQEAEGVANDIADGVEVALDEIEEGVMAIVNFFGCFFPPPTSPEEFLSCIPGYNDVERAVQEVGVLLDLSYTDMAQCMVDSSDKLLGFGEDLVSELIDVVTSTSSETINIPGLGYINDAKDALDSIGIKLPIPDVPTKVKIPTPGIDEFDHGMFNDLYTAAMEAFSCMKEDMDAVAAGRGEDWPGPLCFTISIGGNPPKSKLKLGSLQALFVDTSFCYSGTSDAYVQIDFVLGKFTKSDFGISFFAAFPPYVAQHTVGDSGSGVIFSQTMTSLFEFGFCGGTSFDSTKCPFFKLGGSISVSSKGIDLKFEVYGGLGIFPVMEKAPPSVTVLYFSLVIPTDIHFQDETTSRRKLGAFEFDPIDAVNSLDSFSISELIATTNAAPDNIKTTVLITNRANSDECLGAPKYNYGLHVFGQCQEDVSQYWAFDERLLQNLGNSDSCLTASASDNSAVYDKCAYTNELEHWEFTKEGWIKNVATNKCLDISDVSEPMKACADKNEQKWFWRTIPFMLSHQATDGYSYCLGKGASDINLYLELCRAGSSHLLSMDSSSRLFEWSGGRVLMYSNTANNIPTFIETQTGNANQAWMFTSEGKFQNQLSKKCLIRKAGEITTNHHLYVGPCNVFKRKTLMDKKEYKQIVSMQLGNGRCLTRFVGGPGSAVKFCDDTKDNHHWKLQGGRLINRYGHCMGYSTHNSRAQIDVCTHANVLETSWSYDPVSFWLQLTRGNETFCLRAPDGSNPSYHEVVADPNCSTDPRFQWGVKGLFDDPSLQEQFFFSGFPTKIHVLNQPDANSCLQMYSDSEASFGTCGEGDREEMWVYKQESSQLMLDGTTRCLQASDPVRLEECSVNPDSVEYALQQWKYDLKTRQVSAFVADGSKLCLYWNENNLSLKMVGCRRNNLADKAGTMFGPNWQTVEFTIQKPPSRIHIKNRDQWGNQTYCAHYLNSDTNFQAKPCDDLTESAYAQDFMLTPTGKIVALGEDTAQADVIMQLFADSSSSSSSGAAFYDMTSDFAREVDGYSDTGSAAAQNGVWHARWEYDNLELKLRSMKDRTVCLVIDDQSDQVISAPCNSDSGEAYQWIM